MPDVIAPSKKVTFTVKSAPKRVADQKTLARLMRMQRSVQSGLKRLARRRRDENTPHPRAGRMWVSRVKATKLVQVQKGESFTITVTPQIMADIRAVEEYLDAKAA